MSQEAVIAFFKRIAQDESLKQELAEFAAQHGFDFTADELSDADLEQVAGGLGSFAATGPTPTGSSGCGTTSSPTGVPVPYPNVGTAAGTGGSVKQDGSMPTLKESSFTQSSGDETGTA